MPESIKDTKQITQLVTLYNVTGYIDRDNRIYFAPLATDITHNVPVGTTKTYCQWYMDYFDSIVGVPSEDYHNVSISRWSPSDRTLSVQGTIDLFRKSGMSTTDKAFNYLIVKRTVEGEGTNYVYYMGYFITDAKQTGTNTVQLSLDVDSFTNAFFLMNTKSFSVSELLAYDVFNNTLKNCFVERQHYNRIKVVGSGNLKHAEPDNVEMFLNPQESYPYRYQKKVHKSPVVIGGFRVNRVNNAVSLSEFDVDVTYGKEYVFDYSLHSTIANYLDNSQVQEGGFYETDDPLAYNISSIEELDSDWQVIVRIRRNSTNEIIEQLNNVQYMRIKGKVSSGGQDVFDPEFRVRYAYLDTQSSQTTVETMDRDIRASELSELDAYVTIEFGKTQLPNFDFHWTDTTTEHAYDDTIALVFQLITSYATFENEPLSQFTEEELDLIKDNALWVELPLITKQKIIQSCIHYLVLRCKENIGCLYGSQKTTIEDDHAISSCNAVFPVQPKGYLSDNIPDSLYTYVAPFLIIPQQFDQYKDYIKHTNSRVNIRYLSVYIAQDGTITNSGFSDYEMYGRANGSLFIGDESYVSMNALEVAQYRQTGINNLDLKPSSALVARILGTGDWADLILSATIVKDILNDDIYVSSISNDLSGQPSYVTINSNMLALRNHYDWGLSRINNTVLPHGLWFNLLPISRDSINVYDANLSLDDTAKLWYNVYTAYNKQKGLYGTLGKSPSTKFNDMQYNPLIGTVLFQYSGYAKKDIDIELNYKRLFLSNYKTNYYDPILENNPYTFYSLSYLGTIEVPFNKQKFTNCYSAINNNYKVSLKYLITFSDTVKLSMIPYYDYGEGKQLSFMDSLTISVSSQLPMSSDSYVSYMSQNYAQMKNQYAVNEYQSGTDLAQDALWSAPTRVGSAFASKGQAGGYGEIIKSVGGFVDQGIDWAQRDNVLRMNYQGQLAGAGARPDVVKQTSTDVYYDVQAEYVGIQLNYYRIDEVSYNSIAKGLERFGYLVNVYDTLHVYDRKGWNYIKLRSADFNHYGEHLNLTTEQESDIIDMFREGVTLLHEPERLFNSSLHNYEVILD